MNPQPFPTAGRLAQLLAQIDPVTSQGAPRHWDDWAKRLGAAVDAKDADTLCTILACGRGFNDSSKRAFFALIDLPLPATAKAIGNAIDVWAGVSPEERARRKAEAEARRRREEALRELETAARVVEFVSVKESANDVPVSGRAWIDAKFAAGFTRLECLTMRGAVPVLGLVHAAELAAGGQFRTQALPHTDLRRYARAKIAAEPPNACPSPLLA